MSMRDTSIEALAKLEAQGKGKTRRATVLRTVANSPCAMSRAQIAAKSGLSLQTVTARVNELIHKYKVLDEVPHRIVCPVTGERVHGVIAVTEVAQGELFPSMIIRGDGNHNPVRAWSGAA